MGAVGMARQWRKGASPLFNGDEVELEWNSKADQVAASAKQCRPNSPDRTVDFSCTLVVARTLRFDTISKNCIAASNPQVETVLQSRENIGTRDSNSS